MNTVEFSFEQKEKDTIHISNVEIGDSVLEVALKNNIEIHHNCGGVCACSTCHIYVQEGEQYIDELSDKEEDFIDRARNPKLTSRLGCQCIIHTAGAIKIIVPDQSLIHGE